LNVMFSHNIFGPMSLESSQMGILLKGMRMADDTKPLSKIVSIINKEKAESPMLLHGFSHFFM